jgi:hypothetical protein
MMVLTFEDQEIPDECIPPAGAMITMNFETGKNVARLPKVPTVVTDAPDLAAAVQAAEAVDLKIPTSDQRAYLTALGWVRQKQPVKARASLTSIGHAQPQAILWHLLERLETVA